MKLNLEDIENFTELDAKYAELRNMIENLSTNYFLDCMAYDGQEDPIEKARLEYCSRILDDMHVPIDKARQILSHTLPK